MKLIYISSFIILFIIFIFGVYIKYNFEINVSDSFPKGLYKIKKEQYKKNDYVVFCPPYNKYMIFAKEHGYFANYELKCGNTPKYLKKIMGVEGDKIVINEYGVYINNKKVKNSEAYKKILSDKIFIDYEKTIILKRNEYFLMSDYNKLSYDSRYFGIIKDKNILYKVEPYIIYK